MREKGEDITFIKDKDGVHKKSPFPPKLVTYRDLKCVRVEPLSSQRQRNDRPMVCEARMCKKACSSFVNPCKNVDS